jgi:hypothetical protein
MAEKTDTERLTELDAELRPLLDLDDEAITDAQLDRIEALQAEQSTVRERVTTAQTAAKAEAAKTAAATPAPPATPPEPKPKTVAEQIDADWKAKQGDRDPGRVAGRRVPTAEETKAYQDAAAKDPNPGRIA